MSRKIGLSMGDRIALLNILPNEHNYATLRVIRDLQGKLAPSEEELAEFDVKVVGGEPDERGRPTPQTMKWNAKGQEEKEIEFGFKSDEIIKTALKDLDASNRLTPQTMNLFEKFVGKEEDK